MEYQTCPSGAEKRSTTFDEDAGLNRTACQMKAEGVGGAYNQEKMDASMDGRIEHKLASHCSLVLFNGTNKKVKCNIVIDWFAIQYMEALMWLWLAAGRAILVFTYCRSVVCCGWVSMTLNINSRRQFIRLIWRKSCRTISSAAP